MIFLENIFKEYETSDVVTKVLRGVDLEIQKGEFVSIMGPSGSGKSTLMHIMGFLDRPTSGIYFFGGKNTSEFSDDDLAELRNKEIGFVFQAFHLLPKTTVYENVRLPLMYSRIPLEKHEEMVLSAIEAVGLTSRLSHQPHQLSGGEKQRVAIARALVNNPSLLFADEPTGNLDSQSGLQVLSILQDFNEQGKTIVLVTHETSTAEHARRIIHVRDGKIENEELVKVQRKAKEFSGLK